MYNQKIEIEIVEYINNLRSANSESSRKELFLSLLNRIFFKDDSVKKIINSINLGAEKTIFNIPKRNGLKTGFADTQYNSVIIEFERDLNKTGEHAKVQLTEYLNGNWQSGENYNFTLIATDCERWIIYAPAYEDFLYRKNEPAEIYEIDSFSLTEENADDFFFFIDKYLFKTEKIKATLENIKTEFGERSQVFINALDIFKKHYTAVKQTPEIQNSYEQWHKFLSIAYGSFQATDEIFLIHSYLSVFSKILAYIALSADEFIDEKQLKGIIKGDIFSNYNIRNFIDNDFYYWVSEKSSFDALKSAFRIMIQKCAEFDFSDVSEDILKGVYQELIDIETRHSLGEYYTPDWLCDKIIDEIDIKENSAALDPACGSGSFLRAYINKIVSLFPKVSANEILNNVVGIDIHPLSVQISKTNLLLSLHKKIKASKQPVFLRVYLANTLLAPEGTVDLFGSQFNLTIDNKIYSIHDSVFENASAFDAAVHFCDSLADITKNKETEEEENFNKNFGKNIYNFKYSQDIIDSFHKIYCGLKEAKEKGKDSIWKFILQNLYKPVFLKEKFDFVIGNPPWLTYSDVTNADYQTQLKKLSDKYNLLPSIANMPHLEIAAIFLAHSVSYFLNENGRLAFVLPRSFLTADHHHNTRAGKTKNVKLTELWDLKEVKPLFKVPCCVLFAEKSEIENNPLSDKGIKGLNIQGRIRIPFLKTVDIKSSINFSKTQWYFISMQKRSAFSNDNIYRSVRPNYYKNKFKQGATIVPRNFYFVNILQDYNGDIHDRKLFVETSKDFIKDGKKPWKDLYFRHTIDSNFLFSTAVAKNVAPFILINPPVALLPVIADEQNQIKLLDWNGIKNEGFIDTAFWFKWVEEEWEKHKTQNNKNISAVDYLNWQNKLTTQYISARYLVLYTASAKDANACIVDRKKLDLKFIVESKCYWATAENLKEAYYLTAFLNSNIANKLIKSFQTVGLFGPRDIHKKILEIPLEKFNASNAKHNKISEFGKICSAKSEKYISKNLDSNYNIGKVRLEIRKLLSDELNQIDDLLLEIVSNGKK
ncbi:MAG TPA: N-6 DNA methylase [bacterium]|nr:N-6 DNA methylase [bacterium]